MTANELMQFINRQFWYVVNGLTIRVQSIDAKSAWGDVNILIKPVDGGGKVWVSRSKLTAIAENSD